MNDGRTLEEVARSARAHYAATGRWRATDLLRILGNPAEGVVVTAAQWDRNPVGEKPQALSAKHESPVAEGDAPC